ncbi:uncharacterized protein LY79DRAFT_65012 [Colletotrichum navitas]|uniref:Uncharacterized protein n=1 Tax=Colletotrichum navitas TaxID=681940 RepID=A0AAD8Q6Y8_9PEZI|nr:uncharacterized protein LY79DRAFT_65012 [Colletotrichum navitas]KAK1596441.1 hypothetical protein LY79DRAFT_65012 [Colletotrichum navitas]
MEYTCLHTAFHGSTVQTETIPNKGHPGQPGRRCDRGGAAFARQRKPLRWRRGDVGRIARRVFCGFCNDTLARVVELFRLNIPMSTRAEIRGSSSCRNRAPLLQSGSPPDSATCDAPRAGFWADGCRMLRGSQRVRDHAIAPDDHVWGRS